MIEDSYADQASCTVTVVLLTTATTTTGRRNGKQQKGSTARNTQHLAAALELLNLKKHGIPHLGCLFHFRGAPLAGAGR